MFTKLPQIRLSIIVGVIGLSSIPSLAQKPTPTPERPREIVALLNDARLAAPELAVDTFLRVVESKKVTDPVWRKEIIDEALRTIGDVQYPMPMRPAYGGKVDRNNELNDTEAYVQVVAYVAKLDRLSFKGRVITLLLETDPQRAKQIVFQMGGEFGLKPRSCEDALTYGPEGIYPVVIKVAKAVFTERQIAEGQRALFVAPWIENIEAPRQISPSLDIVQQLQGSAAERQILFNAASRAIDRNFKDDRSFTYAWAAISARTGKLIDGEGDPLKSELKSAFRGMLLKNLRGTRCKDNEIKKDEPLPDYIEAANKLLPEKPLTFEDVSATEYVGTAKLTHILKKSSAAQKFREELLAVRDQQIIDNKVVNHDVTDIAWVSRVNEFIDRVLSFEGSDNETEGEMLFLKSGFVGAMISGISPGDLRNSVIRKYLRLLAGSRLQKTSFIEWRFWITDVERMAPESFYEIASEFPNPNLKVIVAAKRLLAEAKKEPPKPTPPAPAPERRRDIVSLLNDARLAAPELGADTFLKVAESKKITDPVWRREILEEALRMTDDVKYPVRKERAYFGTGIVDTVSGYMTYAYDEKLDTLSLKARIIKDLLSEDKMLARQVAFQIGGDLKLRPVGCEDAMGYVVGDIYSSVGAAAKGAFSPAEIGDGIRGIFLLPWIENIQSPSQIVPAIELLSDLQSPPAERQLLINAFERAIGRSFGDARSFSHAFARDSYKVGTFIREAEERETLISAWREMLVKNTSGPLCLDSKPAQKGDLPSVVASFNPMFPEEKRFSAEVFASVEYKGVPSDKLYLDSEMHKRISLLFKSARETKNLPENRINESAQIEWRLKINQILEALDSWKVSAGEPESQVFNQKTVFYRVMLPEIAEPEVKVVVTRSFMRYLAGSRLQEDSFIEWLYHVRWLTTTEPDLFNDLASEFPNPNFKVMLAARKFLAEPSRP